jgi:hypothetical protein
MMWNITHPFGPRMNIFRLRLALDHFAVKAIEIAETLPRAAHPHKQVKPIAVLTVDKHTVLPIRLQQSEMPTQQFAVSFQSTLLKEFTKRSIQERLYRPQLS